MFLFLFFEQVFETHFFGSTALGMSDNGLVIVIQSKALLPGETHLSCSLLVGNEVAILRLVIRKFLRPYFRRLGNLSGY